MSALEAEASSLESQVAVLRAHSMDKGGDVLQQAVADNCVLS